MKEAFIDIRSQAQLIERDELIVSVSLLDAAGSKDQNLLQL